MQSRKQNLRFIIIGVLLLAGCITAYYNVTTPTGVGTGKLVIIDPGHGGDDPGKIGVNDVLEKDINLQIAKKLGAFLTGNGYTVIFTRTSDCMLGDSASGNKKTADLNARIEIMDTKQADFAISIHQNSYPDSSIHGAQCFYYTQSEEGKCLAEKLQSALIKIADPENTRQAKANDSYYILKNSSCPTVIVECGFLSNPEEAALLSTEDYQNKVALSIATGITAYLNSLH